VRDGQRLHAEVTLPPGVTGEFVWQGASTPLPSGASALDR
jgi:hypothetical protein